MTPSSRLGGDRLFYHDKSLLIPVQVDGPNPHHAAMVLEQFGGANGELKACLQYFVQSFGFNSPVVHDLLLDISTEEISHLELVGTVITQFLSSTRTALSDGAADPRMRDEADALRDAGSTAQKALIVGGGGPMPVDSSGTPFTGALINATGDPVADLSSDLAAELRAKRVYEMLHREIPDRGARQVFDFLIQREEAHAALFKEALERTQDAGVLRRYKDTPFSQRYPALSTPQNHNETRFTVSRDVEPIRGPLGAYEVRVDLARMRG